jgi:hypothetical protein
LAKKALEKEIQRSTPFPDRISAANDLSLIFVDSINRLEEFASAWNNLALAAVQQLPMLSYAWVSSYLECQLRLDESWVCIMALENAKLVGVLPIIIAPCRICGLKRSQLSTPFDWHTISVDMVIEPGRENDIAPFLLSGLKQINREYISLTINRLPDSSPTLALARDRLSGYAFIKRFNGYGSFIKIDGSFEQYKRRLTSRFRRNLRRLERKISSLDAVEYQYIKENADRQEYLEALLQLEFRGWKGKKGSSILQSRSLTKFYRILTQRLAQMNWLEWHFLSVDKKVVSAIMAIRFNRRLIILKIAYDEAYSRYFPGGMLFDLMLEKTFSSAEIDEVDCLTRYEWNAGWNMEKREYFDIIVYPKKGIFPLVGYRYEKLCDCGRRINAFQSLARGLRKAVKRKGDEI